MTYRPLTSLIVLLIFASILTRPLWGLAAHPPRETLVPPSPTPVQVTPPPHGTATSQPILDDSEVKRESSGIVSQWTRIQGWLLRRTQGISLRAMGIALLLILLALAPMVVRRRKRPPPRPLPTSSVPFLKSSDGNLYFRLDRLETGGLVIGRGSDGVDLRIEESTPFVDTVSNQHARIYYDATYGNVIIEDLNSTNGVFINERRAPRKNVLRDGWVIGLGSVTLTYHDIESDTGPLE